MDESQIVSLLIGGIYDAALDPDLWPAVLAKAAAFVGGISAFIIVKDTAAKSANLVQFDGGLDQHYVQLYFDEYVKLDPSTTAQFFTAVGQLTDTADLLPYDEFTETRFYKEWARPQRLVDTLSVTLDKSVTSIAGFGVFRHERQGRVDNEMRRRMSLIAPHVRRAVLIGKVIDLKAAEAATLADTLDGLSAGMFLADAAGRIVHANANGHAMLRMGDYLNAVCGRLAARDPQTDQTLREIFAAAGKGDAALGVKGIAVPLVASNRERYVAHVLPLTAGARRHAGASYAAVAALFVHKASLNTPSPPEAIARTYKLTPTELRVLLAIVEVGGVPEVAETLGVSAETVKTHLGRLFVKTGTGRQADLVKLVAGFASPLAR